jgi:aminopeptidase Y
LNFTYIPFDGLSDYDVFIKHGIPSGGITTCTDGFKTDEEQQAFGGVAGERYDPCYHQICDTVANVNLTAWELNTKVCFRKASPSYYIFLYLLTGRFFQLVAHSVATYARSFDGYPKRTGVEAADVSLGKYHGRKLQM